MFVAISNYCPIGSAPILGNATATTPQTQVTANTSFTCNNGFQSTGGSTSPYYTCLASSSSAGVWSTIEYSCQCMRFLLVIISQPGYRQNIVTPND